MNRMSFECSALILVSLVAAGRGTALAQPNGPLSQPLPLFPADNWWNADVSTAPLDPNSASYIQHIGAGTPLHPDFGGDADTFPATYGMTYVSVPGTQPLVPVTFVEFGGESDAGAPGRPPGYPIPSEAITQPHYIEGGWPGNAGVGGDRHMLLVDRDHRLLFELYHTRYNSSLSRWEAGSGAVFDLSRNDRRPAGWTSADAAGLAILPGLVRQDEVSGPDPIRHALRFTVEETNGFVFPASHNAGDATGALPMGARLRLKASKDISGYPADVQKIFQAMKTYGLIVADNGTDMYIQGTYDTNWNNDELNPAFSSLKASDFEVIQLGWKPTYPATGALDFYTLAPCRLLDTRQAYGATGGPALPPTIPRVLVVKSLCGIPAGAKALVVNLTVVNPPGSGFVRLFPGNADPTNTSTLTYAPGQTRSNNAVVPLASSGSGALSLQSSTAGVHVVLDVMGYFL